MNKKPPQMRRGGAILVIVWVVLAAAAVGSFGSARGAVLEATPKLRITYYYDDNIYGSDPDEVQAFSERNDDVATASYINYLLGIMFRYRQGPSSAEVSGYAGYSQYLTIGGWITEARDDNPADYNSFNADLSGAVKYVSRNITFVLDDKLNVTRDLGQVFGVSTDAIGYWALFTHNIIGTSVIFRPNPKSNFLLRYTYDTITFPPPENNQFQPPDSVEQRIIFRTEYNFNGKTTGIVDFQYLIRDYSEVDDVEYAGYDLYQGMGGIRYRFNSQTYLEALGGWYSRQFNNLSDERTPQPYYPTASLMYDLEDASDPLARVTLVSQKSKSYTLKINGNYGMSTYGQNLYFTYWGAEGYFTYFITPKLFADVYVTYNQDIFDRERNGREWLWEEDRIDYLTTLGASLNWDILQKGGEGTLSLQVGYKMVLRDSNIDSREDYTPEYQNWRGTTWALTHAGDTAWDFDSHDAAINVYYVQFQMLPTILIGD
jgi:hypothetical protein